ncbi:MAG TPA: HEAT repeat domain-containing protein [Pyrinomonadaceae bacterium]
MSLGKNGVRIASRGFVLTLFILCALIAPAFSSNSFDHPAAGCQSQPLSQDASRVLTPLQREIEKQRRRLASSDAEERRDAVMRLGQMKRPDSSRVAASALHDPSAIVRATAAQAVLSLPPVEAAAALLPLLQDRDEFARREAAYALGQTRSRAALPALVNLLSQDKKESVRSSAAVALGEIGDETAVIPLTQALNARRRVSSGFLIKRRRTKPENEFVRRAAARSLGQIGSRQGVQTLIAVLNDEQSGDDVRREAAEALGLIGDPAAIPHLRAALTARDPYLSRTAFAALHKIDSASAKSPL